MRSISDKIIYNKYIDADKQYYDYTLYIYSPYNIELGRYVGRAWNVGKTITSVYLNDVLNSYKPKYYNIENYDYRDSYTEFIFNYNKFKLVWEDGTTFTDDVEYTYNTPVMNNLGIEVNNIKVYGTDSKLIQYSNNQRVIVNFSVDRTLINEEIEVEYVFFNGKKIMFTEYQYFIIPNETEIGVGVMYYDGDWDRCEISYYDIINSEDIRIGTVKRVCGDYSLIYHQRNGALIELPVQGQHTPTLTTTRKTIHNIYGEEVTTNLTSLQKYKLNLGFINDYTLLDGLYTSNKIQLFNKKTEEYIDVIIEDNLLEYKNWKNTRSYNNPVITVREITTNQHI